MIQTDSLNGNPGASVPLAFGFLSIAMTDANLVLSAAQFVYPTIKLTGALTADRNITLPLVAGAHFTVINATTGGHNLVVGGATGATVTVANGAKGVVDSDGTNYY